MRERGFDAGAPSGIASAGVNWEDVRAFRAVAGSLSFTAAAEVLRVGRPAVSRRVQRLERTVGVPLFVRSTRWVRLTEAGTRLLRATEEMAAVWREAIQDVACSRAGAAAAAGELRIAVHSTDIVGVVEALTEAFPGSRWQTRSFVEEESLQTLAAGDVEVVVGYRAPAAGLPRLPDARVELLADEPIWLAVAAGGRLARRRGGVHLRELAEEGWVAHPRPELRALLVDACRAVGFQPDVRHVTGDRGAIRRLVSTGHVVSLSAPTVLSGDDVHVLPLLDGPRRLIFTAHRPAELGRRAGVDDWDERLRTAVRSWYARQARRCPPYWRHVLSHPEDYPGVAG